MAESFDHPRMKNRVVLLIKDVGEGVSSAWLFKNVEGEIQEAKIVGPKSYEHVLAYVERAKKDLEKLGFQAEILDKHGE